MIKSLFKTPLFKKLPFFNNGSSENHVESFNLLQCRDIGHAPSSAIVPCGSAQKQLGAPAILFPSKDRKSKKASKAINRQIRNWLKLVKTMAEFGAKGQIAGINNYINGLENVSPIAAHGKAKNWATPARYFRCEDHSENYAIAKYLSLRLLGFHAERLRVVWLRTNGSKTQHAVLMVKLADQTFVLDSRNNIVTTDDMLQKQQPICSLNGSHFAVYWNSKKPNGQKQAVEQLTRYARRNVKQAINLTGLSQAA